MTILTKGQRDLLDKAVQAARSVAESAAAAEVDRLAVGSAKQRPAYLSAEDNTLRLGLRAKTRQLGIDTGWENPDLSLLVREVAYEQWHRLLFARFLELNDLLLHPDFPEAPLSLADCEELAMGEGEPDGWALAAKYASVLLPGVFRLDDPAVQVHFAPEHRLRLEELLMELPAEVFVAEDSLGWVYQFWQTAEKKRVNDSGDKIGGANLAPVTQLFTENYMVRFLLENSLGAWWAARHPNSPLVAGWEYLRRLDDGTPAAGTFPDWPTKAAEVTVMDPCCGSGHFLVAMFGMLWRMRAEEEGLDAADAQDAVLRDNLFGLELDPRCTQIATFNVTLEAWKQGGYRDLPVRQIACSGIPVRQTREEWLEGITDEAEKQVFGRLHQVFAKADTLGSLITPRIDDLAGAFFGNDLNIGLSWARVKEHLAERFAAENQDSAVLGNAAADVVHAAGLLSGRYTLVATNPPYLQRNQMDDSLQAYIDAWHPDARSEIAAVFIERCFTFADIGGTTAVVSPQNWLLLSSYKKFRLSLLSQRTFDMIARLGSGAFRQITGEVVKVALSIISTNRAGDTHQVAGILAHRDKKPEAKSEGLIKNPVLKTYQKAQKENPDSRITLTEISTETLLGAYATGLAGIQTGDYLRFGRNFWEVSPGNCRWEFQQSTVRATQYFGGREHVLLWEDGKGALHRFVAERLGTWGVGAWIRGDNLQGLQGVAVSQMGDLPVTLYRGEKFDNNTAVILPKDPKDLPAIWAYCSSPEFNDDVREIDDALKITNATLVKVPFDRERWQKAADEMGPLPMPHSDDPTQWLFKGNVKSSTNPLHVAVARLVGYRWPEQVADSLDKHHDADGIVSLQALPGEVDAATRMRALLADAYGTEWSVARERSLVQATGLKSGTLEDWLRDKFFAEHCKIFENRPFVWHVWDGRKDGFSALVDYHRLNRTTLEKLIYTTLGAWIDRQAGEAARGTSGADERLAAAQALKGKLEKIVEGEAPVDVYVRWKEMHEQPIQWDPDLDDGVRLNIRPFVEAGVLRSRVSVHWRKDRGKNPDGSDRINDLHPPLAERRAARATHEAAS
ncbi:Eco57I restriction-modification methylase domain-containing protein [Brachybacterium tyrofermentans]|uniref:Eco57I restriction-modification methylase domain-containing protein n=1 Tax=Brachybacterium tyrofermentans TaxID=47848 RepID=UPI003FD01D41